MTNWVKVALVLVFLAFGAGDATPRAWPTSPPRGRCRSSSTPGLWCALAAGLVAAAFVRSTPVRWSLAVALALSAAFWHASVQVTGGFLGYDGFISQIDATSFVQEALRQYWPILIRAAVESAPLLVGIGLRPRLQPSAARAGTVIGRSPRLAAAPLLGILLLTAVLFFRGGDGARGLPVPFVPLAYVNLAAYERLTSRTGPREPVRLPRTPGEVPYDIALIVDESIAANYLDILVPTGVRTGLADPPPGVALFNYGYAASITNCSAGVNMTLRFGGTRDDYVHMNARMPSIWSYAHAAGLETVFIDAQRTGGMLINGMTTDELAGIDRWVQYDDVPVRDRDMAVAETLTALFADDTPQFVYVNKMGAHFPVHDKAPDAYVRYRPALARGWYEDVADTGSRLGFGGTPGEWRRYRNSYRNVLLWSVGEFFHRLFDAGALDRAVVVYTSDHGQDLHERGNPGLNTHCGDAPAMEEGLVPLVVLQGAGLRTLDWSAHLEENRDRSSHYNIFPTLLRLMG
ncbi:MAG: sulfatase-like hydrolase/transferase, partial [Vicinamibacterales bacterium]